MNDPPLVHLSGRALPNGDTTEVASTQTMFVDEDHTLDIPSVSISGET